MTGEIEMERMDAFLKEVNVRWERDLSMKEYTTFKIGGRADAALFPESREELKRSVDMAKSLGLPVYLVGRGSNLLVSDEGFRGAVIFTGGLSKVAFDEEGVYAECGAGLTALSRSAADMGMSGLEFAFGIPGSVGGAVYMNAGAYGSEMKDVTLYSDYYSPEEGFGTLTGEEQGFGYRTSAYEDGGRVILGCRIALTRGDKEAVWETCRDLLERRRDKQPLEYPSAGSAFKRYPGRYTAQMIDEAGLKGLSVGDAQVSVKHAGFIVNKGEAKASDVVELVERIKDEIYKREGIRIESEIRYLTPKGETKL